MTRVAVVGVGSLGRHHARIYRELDGADLVAVCDCEAERARAIADEYGCEAVTDSRDLVGSVDAVSVVVPTVEHARVGCELLEAGVAALVEKPIAPSLEEADRLLAVSRAGSAVLQVGHVERFNPAVTA